MMPMSSPSLHRIGPISQSGTEPRTPTLLQRYGTFTRNSTGPTSSNTIPQGMTFYTSVVARPKASLGIQSLPNPNTSERSSNMSLTGLVMRSLLVTLISLSVWAILLFGLWEAVPGLQNFVVLLALVLIVLLATSFYLLIILLQSPDNGNSDPQL